MLNMYPNGSDPGLPDNRGAIPDGVIWIDLLDPTAQEIALVEQKEKVRVPSCEDLSEIEVSSRLAKEGDHFYLSAPVIGHAALSMQYCRPPALSSAEIC